MTSNAGMIPVKVAEIDDVNELVKRFKFVRQDGAELPTFSGGAHSIIEMQDGDITRRNPYSLMSDPNDREAYMISVRRDDEGRGGSLFMHNQVREGMDMFISNPVNLFGLDLRAKKHLMIAGGIGITPFMAQMAELAKIGGVFELHYGIRSKALGAYADELSERFPNRVHIYQDDQNEAIDLERLLRGQSLGTHLYVCGPKGMIDWVTSTARQMGWPDERIHSEEFSAPASGEPFIVELRQSGITIEVGRHQSLLEAIEAAGVDAPYLCRGGACGQCETEVLSSEGDILHHDHWLTEEQIKEAKLIMPCVSRFEGNKLVLNR